ncbi:MAG: hypothetical protein ATN35_04295 [Epulopiscium sp. Nele67-Bin004]|nr:MAG: hypothetical protein ATN35_04295 [Epulopiscium sp. Nele67-Bin004]
MKNLRKIVSITLGALVCMSSPVFATGETAPYITQAGISASVEYSTNLVTIYGVSPTATITVVEERTNTTSYLYSPQEKLSVQLDGQTQYTFQGDYNRKYTIKVSDANGTQTTELYTDKTYSNSELVKQLRATGLFNTQASAEAQLVDVTIPIWKLVNGEKVASTATIKVHPIIENETMLIFQEIFYGPEQFPIKYVAGYSWRGAGSSSLHNLGLAIDLNWEENYCDYGNGTIVGKYWSPDEDVYSISPYGDVVRAFENHGFIWGGDAWSTTLDYMHFNY